MSPKFIPWRDFQNLEKYCCEAIDESVFSFAKHLDHGGGMHPESLERRSKVAWITPDSLVANDVVSAVAETLKPTHKTVLNKFHISWYFIRA